MISTARGPAWTSPSTCLLKSVYAVVTMMNGTSAMMALARVGG